MPGGATLKIFTTSRGLPSEVEKVALRFSPICGSGMALIVLRLLRCYNKYAHSPATMMSTCRFASLPSEAQHDDLSRRS